MVEHPVIIDGFSSVEELADAVSGLSCSDLRLFLKGLSGAFRDRAEGYVVNGYSQLAGYGFRVADSLNDLIDYFDCDYAGEPVKGYTVDSLARAVETMRYDSVAGFMGYLRSFLTDFFSKPEELVNDMWRISKKHMIVHEGLDERLSDLRYSYCSPTNIINYFVVLNMLRVERGEHPVNYKRYLLRFVSNYLDFKDSLIVDLVDS